MDDICKNIEEYNPNKQRKILIVFDNIIADMLSNKIFNPIVTELFVTGRKLNISLIFITQSYFPVILNSTHNFLVKIPNEENFNKFHLISQDFMNLYKKSTAKTYSFLVIDTTLASDNSWRFRKNLLEGV